MTAEYVVVIEPDEDGWTASVPDLPGCFSDGDTFEDAETNIREAIRLWVETARNRGIPIPPPRSQSLKIAV